MMSKEKLKKLLCEPEKRVWVRRIDAMVTLLGTFSIGIIFFVLPLKTGNRLLEFSFWIAFLSAPILSFTLLRKTDLSKIERIAVILLILSLIFALMIASFESAKNI